MEGDLENARKGVGVKCWKRERSLQCGEQKGRDYFVDGLELCKTVATSHMWLFKFKLIEIKLRIQFFSHTSHISRAQWPHVAIGYHIAQHREKIFPSL